MPLPLPSTDGQASRSEDLLEMTSIASNINAPTAPEIGSIGPVWTRRPAGRDVAPWHRVAGLLLERLGRAEVARDEIEHRLLLPDALFSAL